MRRQIKINNKGFQFQYPAKSGGSITEYVAKLGDRKIFHETSPQIGMEDEDLRLASDSLQISEDTAVIIPAFNEELTIGSIVLRVKKIAKKVIVVDDGSGDHTSEVAALAGARVIKLNENHGKAYAVKRGIAEVAGEDYAAVVMLDGDGQHDPAEIRKVMEPVLKGEADLVIGSRLIENGHQIPMYRKFGQRVLNRFTNVGANMKVTDSQSGFRAMSMRGVDNCDFDSVGYGLESSMIIHFASRGLVIKEVPIGARYDVPKNHKKGPLSMGFSLISQLVTAVSLRRPLVFMGLPGAIMGLIGLLIGFAGTQGLYFIGTSWIFESILAGFLITVGTMLLISSLTLNSINHLVTQKNSGVADGVLVDKEMLKK